MSDFTSPDYHPAVPIPTMLTPDSSSIPGKHYSESHITAGEVVIYPTHGVFSTEGLRVVGVNQDLTKTSLHVGTDYILSPIFVTRSVEVAKPIYSFIIILRPELYREIQLDYVSVGGKDTALTKEIAAADFDRTKQSEWLLFIGETNLLRVSAIDPKFYRKDTLSLLSIQLDTILHGINSNSELSETNDPRLVYRVSKLEKAMATILVQSGTNVDATELLRGLVRLAIPQEVIDGAGNVVVTPNDIHLVLDPVYEEFKDVHKGKYDISRPTIINGSSTTYNPAIPLRSSKYATGPNYKGALHSVVWQVSETENFDTVVAGDRVDGDPLTWLADAMKSGTTYYARVRHTSDLHTSLWSSTVVLTTIT